MIREAEALYRAALAVLENDLRVQPIRQGTETRSLMLSTALREYQRAVTGHYYLTLAHIRLEHEEHRCADECPFCRGEVAP